MIHRFIYKQHILFVSYHSGLNLVERFEKLDVTLILYVSCKKIYSL